jgi:N-acetyl sugar amidotransferase
MNNTNIKSCTRCLMDDTSDNIYYDEKGICNYCRSFEAKASLISSQNKVDENYDLDLLIKKIKKAGCKNEYDCIVGVSGGVDSSWALVQSIKLGLRPLAVHMDNGWNSEEAQNNIYNLVNELEVDLYTHVIEWDEYRNLMNAFFNHNVVDIELLMDNAMISVNYKLAKKHKVKYILSGQNQSTEGMPMPDAWNWFKYDKKQIKYMGKTANQRLVTFPSIGTFDYIFYEHFMKIKWLPFIDYFNFNKEDAIKELVENYKYKPYPYKHYESVFTRFYQGYILPEKFNIDKRKLHLSTLVMTGQMTRDNALLILKDKPYPDSRQLKQDIEYFIKKMLWSREDLYSYLSRNRCEHDNFPSEKKIWNFIFFSDFSKNVRRFIKLKHFRLD